MAGMSVTTGLISGIDYDTMISQLIQVEANPQKLLQNKLTNTQDDADAYRKVNTKFDALRSAAEALTKATTWSATKATSSSTAVTATASATATAGSLAFEVTKLATTHTAYSNTVFPTSGTAYGSTSITIADADGDTGPVEVTLPAGATLADAVAAINAENAGVTAAAVNTGSGYRLQITAKTTGLDGAFTLGTTDAAASTGFVTTTAGADATLSLGGGITATSPSNTFTDLMPGVSLTVSKVDGTSTTISVGSDPESLTKAMQTLVNAANDVLTTISQLTDAGSTSTIAVLKGDSSLRRLSTQVLESVYAAVGADTAATVGLQTNRDGGLAFNAETFSKALAANPALVQGLVNGTPATTTDGVTTAAVPGVAARLFTLAKQSTDTTTGTLTLLATGQDKLADSLELQIEDWDRRLELRRQTLTAQFSAMETMLGTLQSQSSWLSSQLGSLPSWSSSDS